MQKLNDKIIEKFDKKINTPSFSKLSSKINYPNTVKEEKNYRWLGPTLGVAFSLIGVVCLATFTNKNIIGVGNTEIDMPTEALSLKSWNADVDLIGNQLYYDLPMVYNSLDLTSILNFSVNSWNVYEGNTLVDKEEVPLSYGSNDFKIELCRFNEQPVAYNITVNVGNINQDNVITINNYKIFSISEDLNIDLIINTYEEFNNFLQAHDYNINNVSDYDETYFINKALVLKSARVDVENIRVLVQNEVLYFSSIKKDNTNNTLYFLEIDQDLKNTFKTTNFELFGIQLNNQIKSK